MKPVLALFVLLLSSQVFASHPHDRVCVGSAKIKNADPTEFSFQYEITRDYENGDPNADSHTISMQASHSVGDYLDSDTVKYKSSDVKIAAGGALDKVPVELKDAKGNILFKGTFNAAKETLTGRIALDDYLISRDGPKAASSVVQLNCVSQPLLTLEPAQE